MCIKTAPFKEPSHSTFGLHTVLIYFNSDTMDCVTVAGDLKKLLVAQSNAESQVSVLGKSTSCLYSLII